MGKTIQQLREASVKKQLALKVVKVSNTTPLQTKYSKGAKVVRVHAGRKK